ncbi:MAG: hypothetical protein LBC35_02565 [Coriobacteriales bacterium]|jgi:apolipoprotein N-acyltransferase|nr:hypothetical protein [Coriobacteriales bacterium]
MNEVKRKYDIRLGIYAFFALNGFALLWLMLFLPVGLLIFAFMIGWPPLFFIVEGAFLAVAICVSREVNKR